MAAAKCYALLLSCKWTDYLHFQIYLCLELRLWVWLQNCILQLNGAKLSTSLDAPTNSFSLTTESRGPVAQHMFSQLSTLNLFPCVSVTTSLKIFSLTSNPDSHLPICLVPPSRGQYCFSMLLHRYWRWWITTPLSGKLIQPCRVGVATSWLYELTWVHAGVGTAKKGTSTSGVTANWNFRSPALTWR